MNSPTPAAGTDASLTPAQLETLRLVLNILVPPSADPRMPGAAEIPVLLGHIAEARTDLAAIRADLEQLDRAAIARDGAAFASLQEARRRSLLDEMRARDPKVLHALALETVTCYYQQDRVLEGLGMEARPPYPKGYQVDPGDLSLLAPVIARGRIYREVT